MSYRLLMLVFLFLPGCGAAIAVVDTSVSVAGTVVETTADIAAGAVDVVIGDDEDDE